MAHPDPTDSAGADVVVLLTAYQAQDGLPGTLAGLRAALPAARVVVADDGSTDRTSQVAAELGAEVVRSPRNQGKGGAATLAARTLLPLAHEADPPIVLLCDGDLDGAEELVRLVDEVRAGRADLAVAAFERKVGGGFGLARGFARWAIRDCCGQDFEAPISGQRALRAQVLPAIVPFAPRFGMETGMTIDAVRAGYRVTEVTLPLTHRATGKDLAGFKHRGRQLADIVAAWSSRRFRRRRESDR
jgi:glycosyltransferase involved in cell wall biosynthesis